MATPTAVGVEKPPDMVGGAPSGQLFFLTLPEPTYIALSDVAARHGMTVAQALSIAINDFCKKPSP